MDKSTIKRLAVQTGFTLKEETPHGPDLKPYVYEFAQAVAKVAVAEAKEKSLTEAQRRAVSLFTCWWAMVNAEYEIMNETLDPEAVVLNFMGSGASCMVHAKDIAELCKLLEAST